MKTQAQHKGEEKNAGGPGEGMGGARPAATSSSERKKGSIGERGQPGGGQEAASRSCRVHFCAVKFNMQEGRQRNKRDTSPLKGNIIYSVQPGGP